MNIINALAVYFEQNANNYARQEDLNIRFKARTYASFLDNIVEEDTIAQEDMETIPIYIDNPIGNYDAVPGISKVNQSFEINFFFPIDYKEIMLEMLDYWPSLLVAKRISLSSGDNPICNISKPVFGEVQPATMERFSQFIRDNFGDAVVVKRTDYWLNYKFTIFMGSATSSNGNTMFWGNDIKFSLGMKVEKKCYLATSIVVDGKTFNWSSAPIPRWRWYDTESGRFINLYLESGQYAFIGQMTYIDRQYKNKAGVITSMAFSSEDYQELVVKIWEDLIYTSASTSQNNSPVGQQLIDEDDFVKNVINTTNYGKSIMVYAQNNEFWRNFINYYNKQQSELIDLLELAKTYTIGDDTLYFNAYEQHILSINENISLGELLSFTITFSDAFKQEEGE